MIHICEVGLRDGLQNEKKILPTSTKIQLINKLIDAGINKLEIVSFVNPKIVPQMADAEEVVKQAPKLPHINYAGLVLSRSGLERALKTSIDTIHVVTTISDQFNLKNTKRTVKQAVEELIPVCEDALKDNRSVSLALGTAFGCPYEGSISIERLLSVAEEFLKTGVTNITLADTTGVANPRQVKLTVEKIKEEFGDDIQIGLHFHNTRGLGLANVLAGYLAGVNHFDSSIAGLGGCPFAPKAVGNVCTEDMVNMFEEMNVKTNTDLEKLINTAKWLEEKMDKKLDGMLMKLY